VLERRDFVLQLLLNFRQCVRHGSFSTASI
jgi:hypothetical protein